MSCVGFWRVHGLRRLVVSVNLLEHVCNICEQPFHGDPAGVTGSW